MRMNKLPKSTLLLLFVLLAASACSDKTERFSDGMNSAETAQRKSNKYLAYEHTISVDISEDNLSGSFEQLVEACAADREHNCTILHSRLSVGEYVAGKIRLRIDPEGVDTLTELVASSGKIIEQSTHVEDLAEVITDGEKRITMLETYRDRLMALEEKAAKDIESLIKITSELTKVQSDLERLTGENAHRKLRVDTDIVNVHFVVKGGASFWRPIRRALSSFSRDLAEGLSAAITGVAYSLPWFVVLIAAFFSVRFIWRRSK